MLCIKKSFDKDVLYSFVYKLKGADGKKIERFNYEVENIENGVIISYSIDGKDLYNGQIYIFSDGIVKAEVIEDEVFLTWLKPYKLLNIYPASITLHKFIDAKLVQDGYEPSPILKFENIPLPIY